MNSIRALFLLLTVFFGIGCKGQSTFSRFYDFEAGINDTPLTLLLIDDGFIISADFSGDTSLVSSLIRFDEEGEVQDSVVYHDFVLGESESIIEVTNGYCIIGHRWSFDIKNARGARLISLDTKFNTLKDTTIFYEPNTATNTDGIQNYGDESLIYFETIDRNATLDTRGYIYLLDGKTDTVKQRIVMKGNYGLQYDDYNIRKPQITPDGNFAFIATTDRPSQNQMFELIKINREGEVLNKITGPQPLITNNTLIQDELGDFYFSQLDTPFFIDSTGSFPDSGGGITKLNKGLDSVLWSLPYNRFDSPIDPSRKRYFTRGMRALSDGSFLSYGEIDDISIFKDLAFLVKFNKDGEIIWTRFFKPTLLDSSIRESVFVDCKELPDGRLLCLGQSDNSFSSSPLGSEIWLLMLDEEGCLEPGCGMEQIITSTSRTLPNQSGSVCPNPVSDILQVADVSFHSYVITDMMGRQVVKGDFDSEIHLPSSMPSGMYILQLVEDNQLKSVFKFLKQKG